MDEQDEVYQKTLYDLAVIAEHEKSADNNLICPRCHKEYHMLDNDQGADGMDHGPYECWQTHLEMGFCEDQEKEADPKEPLKSG